jgi:hypothetical protein
LTLPLSSQLENATAPLRLCARLSGWAWGGPVGKADTFSDRLYLQVVRKGLRIRMGRTPAEIAEGAEVYREGGKGPYIGAVFNNYLGQLNRYH